MKKPHKLIKLASVPVQHGWPGPHLPTKLTLLQIHRETVHPTPVTPQAAPTPHSTPRVKLDPPKLSAGSDQETWELFLRSWGLYKSGMNIQDAQSSVYLFNCLDHNLRDDILRANPSTLIGEMSEADLTAAVKILAVKVESKLVHRIRMGQATQAPGHSIRNFHASLKGQAKLCQFKVSCPDCQTVVDYSEEVILDQLVRGISDREILADLLGETKSRRRLNRVQSAVNKQTQSSNPQARTPPAGHVREHPTDQTPSGPGRINAQPGSLPVTSVRVRATIPQPAQSAHNVGIGATKAAKARNALKVRRSLSRRSAPCMPTCVPPSSAVSLRVCSA